MPTPQRAFGDTTQNGVPVTGIATASYAAGAVIGTSFTLSNVDNGGDVGFMITDELIFVGGIAAAPNLDLFLFSDDPSATDNGTIPNLATCIGVITNADITWAQGRTFSSLYDYVGIAQKIFSRRVLGKVYGVLVSRASQSFPQGSGLVGVMLGLSRD